MIRNIMPQTIASQIVGVQPMMGTGKSLFKEYYYDWFSKSYSKKYWPYQYTVARNKITEAERWCWDRFKGRYWNNNHNKFVFKREKDAVMFALRWM